MLIVESINKICVRSGERMKASDLSLIRGMLESSNMLSDFDRRRKPGSGKRTYSCVDLLMIPIWMEVRKTTFGGVIADLNDVGGQSKLALFSMPMDGERHRLCPSESTL